MLLVEETKINSIWIQITSLSGVERFYVKTKRIGLMQLKLLLHLGKHSLDSVDASEILLRNLVGDGLT